MSEAEASQPGPRRSAGRFRLRRLFEPVLQLLRQGLTVEQVAKSLALGCTTGLSPLVGTTTITSGALATLTRLNLVAAITANYAVYPLQLAMIVPFAKAGHWLTGWQLLPLSPSQIRDLISERGVSAFEVLGTTMANAALAWLLCTPVIFTGSFFAFRAALLRWKPPRAANPNA